MEHQNPSAEQSGYPTPDAKDVVRELINAAISPIPYASPIFSSIIASSLEKRRESWAKKVDEGLQRLEHEVEGFKISSLGENEAFVSSVVEITRAAIATHNEEKIEAMRNALLNSALPTAPGDIQQSMFVEWVRDLTSLHLKVLNVFETVSLPALDLDAPGWEKNSALGELASVIEKNIPELNDQYTLFVQIIRDLHGRGLIANLNPERDMLTRINTGPRLTPLAREFLKFIKSPLD